MRGFFETCQRWLLFNACPDLCGLPHSIFTENLFPNFTAAVRVRGKVHDVFVIEIKKPGGKYPGPYSDQGELGKELKMMMIDVLVAAGVNKSIVVIC